MIRKTSSVIVAIALGFFAAVALAQNADKNSAGPTKNDLKIRIAEPLEGAMISGETAQVTIQYNRTGYREQGARDTGLDSFPAIHFDVFLDNTLKQTLKAGENVATINGISSGAHKIVVLAKNISGEVIDRKEINVRAEAAPVSSTMTEAPREQAPVAVAAPVAAPPPAPVSRIEPVIAPPPAPVAPQETLPATASGAPRLALAGLALAAAGLLVSRKNR